MSGSVRTIHVVLFLAAAQLVVRSSSATVVTDLITRSMVGDGLIFTADLLWLTSCKSVTCCAVVCHTDPRCVSFTMSKTSVPGECRAHSSEPESGQQESQGSRLYVLKARITRILQQQQTSTAAGSDVTTAPSGGQSWVEAPCVWDSDCSMAGANVVCFNSKCLCEPGYYYSWSGNNCIDSCPRSQLQSSMLLYSNNYIAGYNDYSDSDYLTLAQCLNICENDQAYRTAEYRDTYLYGTQTWCGCSNITVLQASASWTANDVYDHYQKTCQ